MYKRGGMIMLDFKRILVPYDGSEHAKKALTQAVALFKCCDNAKLFIATVSPPVSATENIALTQAYVLEKEKGGSGKSAGEILLEEAESLLPEGINHELLYRIGNPGNILLDLTVEKNCDLVIMGSRGRSTLQSFLMGSVSSHMVANASCPVCIIK